MTTALDVHRALYDAIETADTDLMRSLWVVRDDTTCTHPGAVPLRGTSEILRGWTALMAQAEYLQFFLTDVTEQAIGDDVVVVTCIENILAGESLEAFATGRVATTSVLCRHGTTFKFWARHAGPVMAEGR